MSHLYSPADLDRWNRSYQDSIHLHLDKLATDLSSQQVDFHLNMLSLSYHTQGMILIAQGKFTDAVGSFRSSVLAKCQMYERYEKGEGRALEAGHFQSVLEAYVTRDDDLVAAIVKHYRAQEGTPDSIFLGRALKYIATNEIDNAKRLMRQEWPRFEPQFVGFADCLEAIAENDEYRFVAAANSASQHWAAWAAKRIRGLPDSVCFIQGIGLIRLAEKSMGRTIRIVSEYLPQELLG
jgi:hypothetical protein